MQAQEKDIQERANEYYASRFDQEMRDAIAIADDYENDDCDAAQDDLREMPLSFEKVITNHRNETCEWEILLGTGGPADRVYVVTDFAGNIESAEHQFQDWFEPWTAAEDQDEDLVRRFAEIVGYYEPTE